MRGSALVMMGFAFLLVVILGLVLGFLSVIVWSTFMLLTREEGE